MKGFFLITIAVWLAAVSSLQATDTNAFPFQVGEKLTYQIYWGPFVAGNAVLEVAGIQQVDGKDCYHLVATARTSGLADMLFHVVNVTESWFDVSELCTRRYAEDRLEGKHRHADDSRYDYVNHQVVTSNLVNGKVKTTVLAGPAQDMISSIYYTRTRALQLDVEYKFPVNVSGTNYDVTVRPDERKSLYFRPVGNIEALRIEPTPTLTVVSANKGRMWFWVSDDFRKLPLLVTTDMKIGSAKFVLSGVKFGPPNPNKVINKASVTDPPAATASP